MNKATPVIVGLIIVAAVFLGIYISQTGPDGPEMSSSIAVIPKTTSGTFWGLVRKGAEDAVDGTDYSVSWDGPANPNDVATQTEIIQDFVEQGGLGLVLAPIDVDALSVPLEKAADANIPSVLIDSREQEFTGLSRMGPDEYIAGLMGARRLAEAIGKAGTVALIRYVADSPTTTHCENGFVDTMKNEFPNVRITKDIYGGISSGAALLATRDLLMRNPTIDGIFTCTEAMSLGVLKAIQDQGLDNRVKMVGFGTDEALLEGLRAGTVATLMSRNPYQMGRQAVEAVIAAVEGRQVDKRVDTGLKYITARNLDTPEIQAVIDPQ